MNKVKYLLTYRYAEIIHDLTVEFCHLESYLLDRQIKAAENKFIREGGYSENLAKKRREYRGY